MRILKSDVASGALLQDVLEFWRNLNLSQLRGKVGLGSLLNLPGALESDLKCSQWNRAF